MKTFGAPLLWTWVIGQSLFIWAVLFATFFLLGQMKWEQAADWVLVVAPWALVVAWGLIVFMAGPKPVPPTFLGVSAYTALCAVVVFGAAKFFWEGQTSPPVFNVGILSLAVIAFSLPFSRALLLLSRLPAGWRTPMW